MSRLTKPVEFTAEMKATHTILVPMMLPIHFRLIERILNSQGYRVVLLQNNGPEVVEAGLKYVHNDTCYPALLVIGQMIDALNSGKYDLHHTSLMITQTGGGCRASNYIHLLRKALKKAGYEHIPVISLNAAGLEKNQGFSITVPILRRLVASVIYGDTLMLLRNQAAPYEKTSGECERLIARWVDRLHSDFSKNHGYSLRDVRKNLNRICNDFAAVPVIPQQKIKVGIVGEIYVKYAALGNNNLEAFLTEKEGCEVYVPGLLGFLLYSLSSPMEDFRLYRKKPINALLSKIGLTYLESLEDAMITAIGRHPFFDAPAPFESTKKCVKGIIERGNKMGEGWLLTAEMIELIEHGVGNIICTQPFGCLPNHVSGKGMIRRLKALYPQSNIVPIDYDPGATAVNQENRIKLMLAMAREQMDAQFTLAPLPDEQKKTAPISPEVYHHAN